MHSFLPTRWRTAAILALVAAGCVPGWARLQPTHLRCEYRDNPEGIGETQPRLGWQLDSDAPAARGERQTAYQILVASSPELLAADRGDWWDSGRRASDATQQIVYAGRPLAARTACWWKVRVWDAQGDTTGWSAPARWSIGLLEPGDWQAEWVGFDASQPNDGTELAADARERIAKLPWIYADAEPSRTSPLTAEFRGEFTVPDGRRVVRALAALTGDQVGSVSLNEHEVGTFSRWEQLRPIDLTAAVQPGKNQVEVRVTQRDGYAPALLGEIELSFSDGTTENIAADTSWTFVPLTAAGRPTEPKPVVAPPKKRNPWDGPPQTLTYWLPPAAYLRTAFLAAKPVRRAMVYATALGAYELHLNGQRVGQDELTPGWTEFHRRVQYQAYDVTALLRSGDNVLGAVLGDGWYASVIGYTGRRYFYGGYPRLLAQLEIDYADGSRVVVATNGTWQASDGPIRQADIMAGCASDTRRERPGWDDAVHPAGGWGPVAVGLRAVDPAKPVPVPVVEGANADPARGDEELPARWMTEPRPGAWTFDLGQNMVGWVRLKVHGRPGQKIMVRHAEVLNPNGTVYTSNLRGANATDVYWLRGGDEVLEPRFTFHGFRYVEVTGLDQPPAKDAVTGVVVHSAMERTGNFECSSALVNQLYRNVVWGQKGNYLEVPTDCPQRDERAGWTGDAEFFVRAGSYNFGLAPFFTRWLETLVQDTELPEGAFGNVAPLFGTAWTAAGWSESALVCTHTLYRVYGDTRIVARNYPAMTRYMAWVARQTKDGVVTFGGRRIGDHLNQDGGAAPGVIETAYYAYLADIMAEMAGAIGRTDDAQRFAVLAAEERAAFGRTFVAPDGTIRDSHQVGYALAFAWNLLPADERPKVAAKFIEQLASRDWHLGTGFIGTPRLLPGLHAAGRDDAAYRVLLQETYPSWLFQVKNGATTIWERWDGWTPEKGFQTISMNSFNHYAFGSVAEYLYRFVAGIDADAAGFRTIRIQPAIAEGLTWAKATYRSASGPIASAWKRTGDELTLTIDVPPNTTATVSIPAASAAAVKEGGQALADAAGVTPVGYQHGAAVVRVGSGHYRFEAQLK